MSPSMPVASRRAVFLDRDGVLNETLTRGGVPQPPRSPAELAVLPGVEEACSSLRAAGWLLIVATNQPEIARGTLSRPDVDAINEQLRKRLPLDDVLICPHDDADRCTCRKPRDGMLQAAAGRWSVDLGVSYMVGDRWRDIEAGRRAGCVTIHVDRKYKERQPEAPDFVVSSLSQAAEVILRGVR